MKEREKVGERESESLMGRPKDVVLLEPKRCTPEATAYAGARCMRV